VRLLSLPAKKKKISFGLSLVLMLGSYYTPLSSVVCNDQNFTVTNLFPESRYCRQKVTINIENRERKPVVSLRKIYWHVMFEIVVRGSLQPHSNVLLDVHSAKP
jgi:hypothetical protein